MKKRITLENDNSHKEEENDKLETQLKDDKFTLAESERKYERKPECAREKERE